MSDVARTRIGRVTIKGGGASVRVLREPTDKDRAYIEGQVRSVLDAHGKDFAGVAFMVWGSDNRSTCYTSANPSSRVPMIMIPDFVRNRLFADRVEHWSIEATLEHLGHTTDKPDPAS